MRNLALMKADPLAVGAEIVWEVVLGHGSDLDKTPFEGVPASSSQARFFKRRENLPEWQVFLLGLWASSAGSNPPAQGG
jgi:hypothetical protein